MSYDVLAMIVNKLFKLGEGLCVDLNMVNVLQWSFSFFRHGMIQIVLFFLRRIFYG